MINVTRGEELTVELALDVPSGQLESLTVNAVQGGVPVLRQEKADAKAGADERQVYFVFTGEETRRFRAGVPAFIQARGTLHGGIVTRSNVEELCVADVLGMGEERPWN